jgi:thiamine kinase-like enzyme
MPPDVEDQIKALPCWSGSITIETLSGGLSNANYVVKDSKGKHVVRVGIDYPFHHVSRAHELMVARAAHAAGFAPQVEFATPGVMVTHYLEAKTFSAADVSRNATRVGALLRAFHTVMPQHVSGPASMFWVFHVIRDYLRTTPNQLFQEQAQALQKQIMPMPIVFGHHDLLPGNFLDDGDKLWLIDFEYASFGTALFDLAGACSNAGMNDTEQHSLIQAYFGRAPDAALQKSFSAMACASLLRETLWAMISKIHLSAPGVDYDAYTAENLTRYNAALAQHQQTHGKLLT